MPELPEVETVKETLKGMIVGLKIDDCIVHYERIIRTPDVNDFKKSVIGQKFNDILRRGKYLIFVLDDFYMISHLRMEGKFYFKDDLELSKHEHVVFRLGSKYLTYHDVRKFGTLDLWPISNCLEDFFDLGPEPFSSEFSFEYLKSKKSKKNIKAFLLDQRIVAGIGNIYVNEILFLSKVLPTRTFSSLSDEELKDIVVNTKKVLKRAVELGGTTIRSYTSSLGVTGRFQNELHVHSKQGEKCPVCGEKIQKEFVAGRGTYFCKNCQR